MILAKDYTGPIIIIKLFGLYLFLFIFILLNFYFDIFFPRIPLLYAVCDGMSASLIAV